ESVGATDLEHVLPSAEHFGDKLVTGKQEGQMPRIAVPHVIAHQAERGEPLFFLQINAALVLWLAGFGPAGRVTHKSFSLVIGPLLDFGSTVSSQTWWGETPSSPNSVVERTGHDGVTPHRSWPQLTSNSCSSSLPMNRAPSPHPSPHPY